MILLKCIWQVPKATTRKLTQKYIVEKIIKRIRMLHLENNSLIIKESSKEKKKKKCQDR